MILVVKRQLKHGGMWKRLPKKRGLSACLLLLLYSTISYAQFEPQFTQFMFNEMFINPAYAGSRKCLSVAGTYRNQWVGMEGAPKTQTFSMHSPINKRRIALGFSLMNEEIGVTSDLSFFGTYAYRIPIGKGSFSMAANGGLIYHQEKLPELNVGTFGDYAFMGVPRLTAPNAGFGTWFNTDDWYVGLSVPRMLQNRVDPATGRPLNKINVEIWHYYLMGGYVFPLNDILDLRTTCMVKAVSGAPVLADIGAHLRFYKHFWLGGSYRTADSWSALFQLQVNKQLRIGYSYDYTLTELRNFNSGTHEITLGIDFSLDKVKEVSMRNF